MGSRFVTIDYPVDIVYIEYSEVLRDKYLLTFQPRTRNFFRLHCTNIEYNALLNYAVYTHTLYTFHLKCIYVPILPPTPNLKK